MDKTKIHKPAYIFNKYAKEYQNKYMDVSAYHDSLDIFCKNIQKENAAVLDIACGPGNITKSILEKYPRFKILGIDLSQNMIGLAKKNNPSGEFKIMDGREINKLHNMYDGIICGFCLPYLSKEETLQLISDTAGLLNPNGVFYLSMMEGDYSKSGLKKGSSGDKEELFIYYHEAGYLMEGLKRNGFKLIDLKRIYAQQIGDLAKDGKASGDVDLVLVAKKKYD